MPKKVYSLPSDLGAGVVSERRELCIMAARRFEQTDKEKAAMCEFIGDIVEERFEMRGNLKRLEETITQLNCKLNDLKASVVTQCNTAISLTILSKERSDDDSH